MSSKHDDFLDKIIENAIEMSESGISKKKIKNIIDNDCNISEKELDEVLNNI